MTPAKKSSRGGAPERVIDVDAHRKARHEAQGTPPMVKVGGRTFELPEDLPAEVVYAFGAATRNDFSQIERGMRALFGEEAEALFELMPAWQDQEYLIEQTIDAYGFTLPESAGSASS